MYAERAREELGIDAGPVITELAGDRKELRVVASRDELGGDRLHAVISNGFLDLLVEVHAGPWTGPEASVPQRQRPGVRGGTD